MTMFDENSREAFQRIQRLRREAKAYNASQRKEYGQRIIELFTSYDVPFDRDDLFGSCDRYYADMGWSRDFGRERFFSIVCPLVLGENAVFVDMRKINPDVESVDSIVGPRFQCFGMVEVASQWCDDADFNAGMAILAEFYADVIRRFVPAEGLASDCRTFALSLLDKAGLKLERRNLKDSRGSDDPTDEGW